MKIILAKYAGFCGGVRQACILAEKEASINRKHYTYGPLIHNPQYVNFLTKKGLMPLQSDDIPKGTEAIVTRAHGVTKAVLDSLQEEGVGLIDGTCPVLLDIYKKVCEKQKLGYEVILIGDPNHPEVIGINGQALHPIRIIQTEKDAEKIVNESHLYIISQTTNRINYFNHLAELIVEHNKNVIVESTICNATTNRQKAAQELAKEVDIMIVIGGKNSSNTQKLYSLCKEYCSNVFHIESANEINAQKLQNYSKSYTIGVTAGASTPDWIIEEVVGRMDQITNEEFMDQVEDSMVKIYPKDIVKGTVIAVKDNEIFVNINYRADGIIQLDEMSNDQDVKPQDLFEEGQEIDVYVIKLDDGEGNVVLSTRRVEGLKNWKTLVEKYENEAVVQVQITADNKGGLVGSVMGIQGFMPASQITTYFVRDLKQYVGQEMDAKIISLDEKKRRIVLSHRVIDEERVKEVWDSIQVGETHKGTVARLTDFGAFVNLGGVDGLIHISDISWTRISKPEEVLSVGQEVEVLILRANRERNRISLGLKQLTKKPFEIFLENNNEGDVVKGTVVNLLDFGAFVRLKEGVEGLVHVSQISYDRVEKPSDELAIGQEIEVKILEIDRENQRIALSIKELLPEPEKKPAPSRPRRERRQEQAPAYENQELTNNMGDLFEIALQEMEEDNQ